MFLTVIGLQIIYQYNVGTQGKMKSKDPLLKTIKNSKGERVDIKQRKRNRNSEPLLLCPDHLKLLTSKNFLGEMNSFYRFLHVSSADPTQG